VLNIIFINFKKFSISSSSRRILFKGFKTTKEEKTFGSGKKSFGSISIYFCVSKNIWVIT